MAIHNVNNRMVEIGDELYPAVNIQVRDVSPEIYYHAGHDTWYGIHFEVMFENGVSATICQEAAEIASKRCESVCTVEDIDHFLVEITDMRDRHHRTTYAYHCVGEDQLLGILKQEKKINTAPSAHFLFCGVPA